MKNILILILAIAIGAVENNTPSDPYSLLTNIPAFSDLFFQKGLSTYSAETKIEGNIRKSLDGLATEKGLPSPEFNELYDVKRGFTFKIGNVSYPPMLKRMIEEMFIPVLVFDRVIAVMESKREYSWFQRFKSITTCDAKYTQYQDKPCISLAFSAKNDSAIETKTEGNSTSPTTTKLVGMTFLLEQKSKLVELLKLDQIEKIGARENRIEKKFLFEYTNIGGRYFPSALTIMKDGKEEIRFKAEYQPLRGFTVFKSKQFRYVGVDGKPETINISYGKYSFNKEADLSSWESGVKGQDALTKEADAEKLFEKARKSLMNGDASKAKSILKKIIKDYPQTTVAEQATALIDGIP